MKSVPSKLDVSPASRHEPPPEGATMGIGLSIHDFISVAKEPKIKHAVGNNWNKIG